MSVPSYTSPPRQNGTGWKIAGIGCLALFLLAAIGGVLLVRTVKERIDHPSKNDVMGIAILAGQAGVDGVRLQQAVVAYRQTQGHYPKTLEDLVLEGAVDGKLLHNALDGNPSPGHVSWRYTRPAENAPGETPILEEPYQMTIGGKTQSGQIIIALDGHSQTAGQMRVSSPPANHE